MEKYPPWTLNLDINGLAYFVERNAQVPIGRIGIGPVGVSFEPDGFASRDELHELAEVVYEIGTLADREVFDVRDAIDSSNGLSQGWSMAQDVADEQHGYRTFRDRYTEANMLGEFMVRAYRTAEFARKEMPSSADRAGLSVLESVLSDATDSAERLLQSRALVLEKIRPVRSSFYVEEVSFDA